MLWNGDLAPQRAIDQHDGGRGVERRARNGSSTRCAFRKKRPKKKYTSPLSVGATSRDETRPGRSAVANPIGGGVRAGEPGFDRRPLAAGPGPCAV
ncbi:hypothetical protein SKAU_G00202990 [Synaphobranchus kaupii]|uniref:Uncharacterized protein n=1 Tax=Synaphobranchus kaupii TaxID=118154 RepID=A0A9Q1IYK0_SYNKA|nr:hypothetical protein SKAU_G00202990 [Synaphobranchus kaupii]